MAKEFASLHDFRWENDPAFGLVHPTGCIICRHYMTHIAAAATDAKNHPTFKPALEVRDSQYNTQFLSGIAEGRRLQRDYDMDQLYQLKACRAERDEAVEETCNVSAQLRTSQEELVQVKEQFHALQILFEEVVEINSRVWEERGPFFEQQGGYEDSQGLAFEARLLTPPSSTASSSSPDMAEPSPSLSISSQHSNKLQAQLPVTPPTLSVPSASRDPASDLATPTTVQQMESLMNDGCRPGKTEALDKVRKLCTRASLTPRQQQTEPQRYLLSSWKGPKPASMSPDKEEYTLRRNREAPMAGEVSVDSSPSWGIGFMMNGRWLAWKFKPGWQSMGKDNHWAEMVAVEVGLRVAIATGHHSGPLTVRSDNTGVVRSLTTGEEKNQERLTILRNIQRLSRTYNIQVIPKWISTKENPADGPSRGVFPSRALLLLDPPAVPAHLTQFLEHPITFNSLSR